MKKNIILLITAIIISFAFSSCNKGESYADKLKRERKNISNLISDLDLNVNYNGFPADGKFDPNVYYKDEETGVYLNITSYGDTSKMAVAGTQIIYRFKTAQVLGDTTILPFEDMPIGGDKNAGFIIYGNSYTYTYSYTSSFFVQNDYLYRSPACLFPLQYVGKGATFNIIIPFNEYAGSAYQQASYVTMYLKDVKYTRFN